jgi:hypothetical protein
MKLAILLLDLRHNEHGNLLSDIIQVDWRGRKIKSLQKSAIAVR